MMKKMILFWVWIFCATGTVHAQRYFEFIVPSDPAEYFIAQTSDPDVISLIENQLLLPLEERNYHIHGPIDHGNGDHNLNWSWHFVPDQWSMVETSAEVCDGCPHMVESDLTYWIHTVGLFCPWSSKVTREYFFSSVQDPASHPATFQLSQNFPNPFNPTTQISFSIPEPHSVRLKIYDLLGREVETLVNGFHEQGTHSVLFNAEGFSDGIYFYRLYVGNTSVGTKKMVLLR